MKAILLASGVLAATAGFAAAEVTLSGDARMGVISDYGTTDMAFTSRARVKFTLSGSTDGGLEFGASFRAHQAVGAAAGTNGSVFISGTFGKLSMGDVDGAGNAAVGQVSGVGLTGLGDLNELAYNNGGDFGTADPSALYEYATGDLTIYASVTQPTATVDAYGIGAKYVLGDYTVAIAYEALDDALGSDFRDLYVGGSATFGAVTVKAIFGHETSNAGFDENQVAVSVDYKADALTVTAFYTDDEAIADAEAFGLGASYDLGGGASIVGGYVKNQTTNEDAFDLGVDMSF